jgi:magnesium and cobalt transporter
MSEKDELPRGGWRRFFRRFRRPADVDKATEEALSDMEESGFIDPEESEMMQGVLDLDKTTAREIFVPRTEIVFVDTKAPLPEVIARLRESGLSRLPVVDGSVDKPLGFVHVKDLLRFWGRESEYDLTAVLKPAFHVPESKKLDDLLEEFQQNREKIALVVDEFGGTSGLVTITDILEEIVGDLGDDAETREESRVFFADENMLVVPGRFAIDLLRERFGGEAPAGAFNTAAGWILDRTGRVPQTGETFELDGFTVKIEAATERHIRKVSVRRMPAAPDE